MKKRMMLVVLFGLILITSCGTKLTSESFDDLGNDMTADEVIDILGKPSETLTKKSEVEEFVDEEISTFSKTLALINEQEDSVLYKKIHDLALSASEVKVLLGRGEIVKILKYNYKTESSDGKKEKKKSIIF